MALAAPSVLLRSRRVAIIGAGAAGLAAARELRNEGHDITVFEANADIGGTWAYSEATGHSSLYESLRTNLPRSLMAFSDVEWTPPRTSDSREYPGHAEVMAYLAHFYSTYALEPLVRFGTRVLCAEPIDGNCWRLSVEPNAASEHPRAVVQHEFDALCVCNGHYSEPRSPTIPGLAGFAATRPGAVTHSHEYRRPDRWQGLAVLVVGAATSGDDISRELASVARRVLWSGHSFTRAEGSVLCTRPDIVSISLEGRIAFSDGGEDVVDAVLLATGYHFHFPFLGTDVLRSLGYADNCFDALYEHLFDPDALPTLFFIGLPWKVVPFPLFELQSRLAARLLSGRVPPPPPTAVEAWRASWSARLRTVLRRHAHALTADELSRYQDRLADAAQCPRLPAWRTRVYAENASNRLTNPADYRDAFQLVFE